MRIFRLFRINRISCKQSQNHLVTKIKNQTNFHVIMSGKKIYWSLDFSKSAIDAIQPGEKVESGIFAVNVNGSSSSNFSCRVIPKGKQISPNLGIMCINTEASTGEATGLNDGFYMSVFLKLQGIVPCDMDLKFDLIGKDDKSMKSIVRPVLKRDYTCNETGRICWGSKKFILLRKILDNPDEFTPDQKLTLCVAITCTNPQDQTSFFEPSGVGNLTTASETSCIAPYKDIFTTKYLSDVVIKVRDSRIIRAHKVILATGSPVFKELIEADKRMNELDLSQYDHDVVNDMLQFIYLRKIENIQQNLVVELYTAALQFQLPGLIDICNHEMEKSSLIKTNFTDVISLAMKHQLETLFDKCVDEMRR